MHAGASPRSARIYVAMLQIFCLLLAWSVASPPSLLAQSPVAAAREPAEYQVLINDAIREYRDKNFAEARSLFTRANQLFPNARAARGVGMAEFELRNYDYAIDWLRSALESTAQPLEGELRKETEGLLARAEAFVARLKLDTTPVLPTTIMVDGSEVQLRPGNVLVLAVGDHLIELHAPGSAPAKIQQKVQGGEQSVLRVSFQQQEAPALPPVASDPSPAPAIPLVPASIPAKDTDPRRPLYKNPWLWTGVGVVVAGAAVGLALGLRKDGGSADPLVTNPIYTTKGP